MKKLNPHSYSLTKAQKDIATCNKRIVEKSEEIVTLKDLICKAEDSITKIVETKSYIKSILVKKKNMTKNFRKSKTLERLLKE